MLNSHKCISLIYVRQFSLGNLPFLISVHLKISALFVVSHFLSVEVSPEIMEVKINPGFWTQKKPNLVSSEWRYPKKRMINYTICSIKPTWMRLLPYIYCMG